jgi:hypothetical protein
MIIEIIMFSVEKSLPKECNNTFYYGKINFKAVEKCSKHILVRNTEFETLFCRHITVYNEFKLISCYLLTASNIFEFYAVHSTSPEYQHDITVNTIVTRCALRLLTFLIDRSI